MSGGPSPGPLRNPAFAWYLASRTVNMLGFTAASVAMAFAVLDLGGSATALGQVLAARTVPMVLVLLFGGVLADRLPRSLVLQASNLVNAGAQGATAVLLITGTALVVTSWWWSRGDPSDAGWERPPEPQDARSGA